MNGPPLILGRRPRADLRVGGPLDDFELTSEELRHYFLLCQHAIKTALQEPRRIEVPRIIMPMRPL